MAMLRAPSRAAVLTGLAFFTVLQAVAHGLNVLLEMDFNNPEQTALTCSNDRRNHHKRELQIYQTGGRSPTRILHAAR